MSSAEEITGCLERCYSEVAGDAALRADFQASRAEFFARPEGVQVPGSELRHLEWFLLERPSPVLGAVPIVAWTREDGATSAAIPSDLRAALLGSIPGSFEVTSSSVDGSLWVRDLFTLGEHPLASSSLAAELQVGDLLVGRLFPATEGVFVTSSAAVVYRSPELLSAVRADLAAMRKARRGVLRIQQLELERLFLGSGPAFARPQRSSAFRERARTELVALGLDEERVAEVLTQIQRAVEQGIGSEVTKLLNQLAFETHVDLARTRQILVDVWEEERRFKEPPTRNDDVRAALEAFDRGRTEGKDLEILFRDLERNLGLETDSPPEDEESAVAPDFPGVVGALVEEFLWDLAREKGAEHARNREGLRVLGEYARDIGVLEDLGRFRLLDFTARWLLDEARLGAKDLEVVLEALQEFCFWAEEHHDIPLRREFESSLRALGPSVVRLASAREHCGSKRAGEMGTVVSNETGLVAVELDAGETRCVRSEGLAANVQPGDVVRLDGKHGGIVAAYPAQLRELLDRDR